MGKNAEKDRGKKGEKKQIDRSVSFLGSIRFKLIMSFLVPVACIAALGISAYEMATKAVYNSYLGSMEQTMQMVEDYMNLVVDTEQSKYKGYINDDDLKKYFSGNSLEPIVYRGRMTTEFKQAVTGDALLSNVYFLSQTQEPIATVEISGTAAFEAFLATPQGEIASQNPNSYVLLGNQSDLDSVLGIDSSRYSLRLARKFVNSNTYMIIDFSHAILRDSLASLSAGADSYVGLITCDGVEFVLKDGEAVSLEEPVFSGRDYYVSAAESLNASEAQGFGMRDAVYQGKRYHFLYRSLGTRGAMITALVPDSYFVAQAADIRRLTLIITVLAGLAAFLLGYMIARNFSNVIRHMIQCLKRVSDGDLTVNVSMKRRDEFRLLAEGITGMIAHMKQLITDIRDVGEELTAEAEEVSQSSGMFMDTSKNIQQSIGEIEKGVQQLDEDSDNCLNQMDGLSGRITSVSGNSGQVMEMTRAAGACIENGMEATGELTASAQSTTRITGEVLQAISELKEKMESIGQIVGAINEIAEETNLLSLNASIEAARAGESGKGFAVVAEEIRKLADQSLQSAGRIEEIISEMIQKTENVASKAKAADDVVASQSDAVSATIDSFKEIRETVSALLKAMEEIDESVRNMDSDRAATLGSIENISAVSAETAAASSEVNDAADKQMQSIIRLENASEHLQNRAVQLGDTLKKFRL